MKIIADAQIPYIKEYFGTYGNLRLLDGRKISHADVKDADVLIVRSITPVNEKLLGGSKVKFVGSVTAGADHLDTKWLDEANIPWNVAVGFNAPPVADYVVSVIASLQRRNILASNGMRAAVIGVGNVGRLVVNVLQLLNFDIVLCDPIRAAKEKKFISVSLENIQDCDLISLHVPLTKMGPDPTFHFINQNFLQRQKEGCVLLNASRGAVVDSHALLEYGRHLHWCLDVWEHEPRIDKALLQDALIATPHIAGYSVQSKIRGIDMIYRIACERDILQPLPFVPRLMSDQMLAFAKSDLSWQEIILGVFNPDLTTELMRSTLLPTDNYGILFDQMRNQFNYRHEFKSTKIEAPNLSEADRLRLKKLGLKVL